MLNRKYFRCSKDAEASDIIHTWEVIIKSVMAQFVIPAPEKKDSQNRFKKWRTNSATESIKSQTSGEVKYEETTRFEERYRELERKIVQKVDTSAGRGANQQQPVSTSKDTMKQPQQPHTKGKMKQQPRNTSKNVMKHPQPKTRGGVTATAAAEKKSDREDILMSQNNENCKSEEDEEIMALIEKGRSDERQGMEHRVTLLHQAHSSRVCEFWPTENELAGVKRQLAQVQRGGGKRSPSSCGQGAPRAILPLRPRPQSATGAGKTPDAAKERRLGGPTSLQQTKQDKGFRQDLKGDKSNF